LCLSWIFRNASMTHCSAGPWQSTWIGATERQQERKEREESYDLELMKWWRQTFVPSFEWRWSDATETFHQLEQLTFAKFSVLEFSEHKS
jgi:hypothetical protein